MEPTIWSQIPEELLIEILIWVPIKFLVRFTLVCKSWKVLITTSRCIQVQRCKNALAKLSVLPEPYTISQDLLSKLVAYINKNFHVHWNFFVLLELLVEKAEAAITTKKDQILNVDPEKVYKYECEVRYTHRSFETVYRSLCERLESNYWLYQGWE